MTGNNGLPWVWGVPVEPAGLPAPKVAPGLRLMVRAIAMKASWEIGSLWLCQMRCASCSHDRLDSFGRHSPQRADSSLINLAVGQSFMTVFKLTDFTDGESLTPRMKVGHPTWIFGAIILHYHVKMITESRSWLATALRMSPISRVPGKPLRYLLTWGDLLMMHRQLLTLTVLAERDTGGRRGIEEGC